MGLKDLPASAGIIRPILKSGQDVAFLSLEELVAGLSKNGLESAINYLGYSLPPAIHLQAVFFTLACFQFWQGPYPAHSIMMLRRVHT